MPYILILIGCLGLTTSSLGIDLYEIQQLDVAAVTWMNLHRSNFISEIAIFLSKIGGLPAMLCVCAAACLISYRLKKYIYIHLICFSFFGAACINWALKYIFDRPRPDAVYQMVQTYGASYPSAHSLYATILSCLMVLIFRQHHYARYIFIMACLWSIGMGISRVYLGVHFPTDILAGWSIAFIWIGVLWSQFKPFMVNENNLI